MNKQRSRAIAAGIALIVLGVALWFLREKVEGLGRGWILVMIGGVMTTLYFYSRKLGWLIPGCLTLSLGLGSIGERSFFSADRGNFVPLGLGFVAIYVIQLVYERRAHWWPLIPGLLLIALGFDAMTKWIRLAQDNWPLLLALVGALIIVSALFRKGGDDDGEDTG